MNAQEARQEAARQATLGRILRTWKHQHTSRAFDGWRELVRTHKQLLSRSMQSWRNGLLSSAWRRWAALLDEVRDMRAKALSALGRWTQLPRGGLCTGATSSPAVGRRAELLGKTIGRWTNRLLARAFLPWRALPDRSRDQAAAAARATTDDTQALLVGLLRVERVRARGWAVVSSCSRARWGTRSTGRSPTPS